AARDALRVRPLDGRVPCRREGEEREAGHRDLPLGIAGAELRLEALEAAVRRREGTRVPAAVRILDSREPLEPALDRRLGRSAAAVLAREPGALLLREDLERRLERGPVADASREERLRLVVRDAARAEAQRRLVLPDADELRNGLLALLRPGLRVERRRIAEE